jgi:ATP-dependent exoDNAse (exonuclease V) beta subunit
VLAVTFANKATQEMKDRILFYLDEFANGRDNELAHELKKELNLDDLTFRQRSQEVQSAILHTYSQFAISTIDAFFQKVIRSFTREAGLVGDYRLEVDQEAVLAEVIDNLIDELGSNEQLTKWVVDFAKENLENDRAWDVRHSLQAFAQQIFREEFKAVEDELTRVTSAPDFFKNLLANLKQMKFEFVNLVKGKSKEALDIIHANGLFASDFKYAGGGVYSFFKKLNRIGRVKDFDEIGVRPEKEYQDIKNWPGKDTINKQLILTLAEEKLLPMLNEILTYWHKHYVPSFSAELVLNNFYAFGLITDISRKLTEYKNQNNLMLLADAPKFLNGVIQDSDTPFIYEKVGSFFRNYLIDEFQDTSGYQWKNFLPLLKNGLDQGYPSLVVGDVKQAIYRWRGGDLKLLQEEVEHTIGAANVAITELGTNYRSAIHVVDFNNAIFKTSAVIVGNKVAHKLPVNAFHDVTQKISKTDTEGFVQVTFIREEADEEKWKDIALMQVPVHLEQLQQKGVPLKDIAILVRKNEEGQHVAAYLLQYKNSDKAKPDCRYDVISNESLRLDGAASVNLLLAAMKYLLNPEDPIARAQLGFEFAKLHEPEKPLSAVFVVGDAFEHNLPGTFTKEKMFLKKLPLFELTETLIEIFKLGTVVGELTYLLAFQDLVLDFYSRERNDLGAFLEWWEDNKHKKSIQASGDIEAVQIFSIHKSKGLQFKYVIIPFCSWNMDHDVVKAPLLWVKSDQPPFKEAGYLPVAYASALKETAFSAYYEEEFTRVFLDNLNLLYVAFTRAEHGLIVCAPHPKSVRNFSVAALLHESISTSDDLLPYWNEAKQIWKKGECMTVDSSLKKLRDDLVLTHYPIARWRNKLVLRQSNANYFESKMADQVLQKISYGVHMHAVLSRLRYKEDMDAALNHILFEGLITTDEKEPIQKQLDILMSNSQVSDWFSASWEVKTEVPILLPGGGESRIDRLMINGKHAIVVDFKTGEQSKADHKQVQEYINTLRQMNFIDVEGYLLYLKDNEIVSISTTAVKTVRKKDESQLGLGL